MAPYTFAFSPVLLRTHRFGCPPGASCRARHVDAPTGSNYNNLVCKHWLRGLSTTAEHCEFLHEYNLRRMPECSFFARNGYCSNGEECLYLHVDPESRLPACGWYDRGFCPLGPRCARRHVRRDLCRFYLAGFCPEGKKCPEGAHARWKAEGDLEELKVRVVRDPAEVEEEI
ncbi:hypothetical protein VE04_08699, partial [Pseudogymnoascus sp. 24MN13]